MPAPMSQNVNAYEQLPSAEQAEELFKQRLSQMAYNVLFAKFADLAPQVVTFKILESEATTGKATGAFILLFEGKTIYIPIVMVDSSIKPLDMFFFKDLNIFLPLSKEWLEEISKMSLTNQGEPSDIPAQVPQDVNIRDLILPPVMPYGRVGLAAANDDLTPESMDFYAKHMFKEAARNNTLEMPPRFLEFISKAPTPVLDGIKLAFELHPDFLKAAVSIHGKTAVTAAFQTGYANAKNHEKRASVHGEVRVFTRGTPTSEIRQMCGSHTGEVFSDLLKVGVAAVDTRPGMRNATMPTEHSIKLQPPDAKGGFMRLFFADAAPDLFYVVPLGTSGPFQRDYYGDHWAGKNEQQYLIIKADASSAWTEGDVIGAPVDDLKEIESTKIYKMLEGGAKGDTPSTGSYGFFIYQTPSSTQVTRPDGIKNVWDTDGRKRIECGWSTTYVIDDTNPRKKFDFTLKGEMVFLPKDVKWITLAHKTDTKDFYALQDEMRKYCLLKDPQLINRWLGDKLNATGMTEINVKRASTQDWWVNGSSNAYGLAEALHKVASDYNLSICDAGLVLIDSHKRGACSYKLVTPKTASALRKLAAPMQQQEPQQSEQSQVDPAAAQQMQMQQMQQMAPPTISPTDLAIAETLQSLQQESQMRMQQMQAQAEQTQQQLQQQQQQQQQMIQQEQDSTSKLVGVLQQIQQRSQMLSQATGGMIPQGAEQSPAAAAGMIAPMPQPEEEPPPTPTMTEEALSPESIAQQINPQMAQQAAGLKDQGVFDTAALATLAAAPMLQDMVSTYVPNLEKALDNLGRILLTLWMREGDVKDNIGSDTFIYMEDKLRNVFKGLGEVVLTINKNAVSSGTIEQSAGAGQMVGDQQ